MLQLKEVSLAMLLSIAFYATNHAIADTTAEPLYSSAAEINAAIDQVEKHDMPFTIVSTLNGSAYMTDCELTTGKATTISNTFKSLVDRYKKGYPLKLSLNRVDELQALLSNYVKSLVSVSQSGLEFPTANQRPLLALDCKEGLDMLTPAEIKAMKMFFVVTNPENYRIKNIFDEPATTWPTGNMVIKTIVISAAIVACVALGVVIYRKLNPSQQPAQMENNEQAQENEQQVNPIGPSSSPLLNASNEIGHFPPIQPDPSNSSQSSQVIQPVPDRLPPLGASYPRSSPTNANNSSSPSQVWGSQQVGQTDARLTLVVNSSPQQSHPLPIKILRGSPLNLNAINSRTSSQSTSSTFSSSPSPLLIPKSTLNSINEIMADAKKHADNFTPGIDEQSLLDNMLVTRGFTPVIYAVNFRSGKNTPPFKSFIFNSNVGNEQKQP